MKRKSEGEVGQSTGTVLNSAKPYWKSEISAKFYPMSKDIIY